MSSFFPRLRALLFPCLFFSFASPALAEEGRPVLVESEDDIGFTLDEDWREWWRRISDRGGRYDPDGPMQQRFPVKQYPTHQSDMATGDFLMGDEAAWANQNGGARWWVHSFNAVELGNSVQIKYGRKISPTWSYDIRYDRLYTRDTQSDLVQANFTWQPKENRSPYISIGVFPRIEKQDSDLAITVGYKDKNYGDARVRIWALDAFATAAYAVATSRGSPLDHLYKQKSVPLGIALELASVRIGGFRSELYVGGMVPQTAELYTEELERLRTQKQWSTLFGGMLEYKFKQLPIWVGTTAMMVSSSWSRIDREFPEENQVINEDNLQGRIYALAVPRQDMRVEGYYRLTWRPEEVQTVADPLSFREDFGTMMSLRWQWLLGKRVGYELSYWGYHRQTEGPPEMKVDGDGHRIATRMLWHMDGLRATFGIGWDPQKAGFYDGAGGTLAVDF